MNKRIKKKKKKQEQQRLINSIIENPKLLEEVLAETSKVAKEIYKNMVKLIEEVLKMAEDMKTSYFVGEDVIADGIETEITEIDYDENGEKVYMVKGSAKSYHFDQLRRVPNADFTDKEKMV